MFAMASQFSYVAFFDLDETILNVNSGKLFWEYCWQHQVYNLNDLANLGVSIVRFAAGIDEVDELIENWAKNFADWPEEKMEQISQGVFQQKIKRVIREKARLELERHRQQGGKSVILSASTQFICEPIKNHMGFDDLICTQLEILNGRYTGKLNSPHIYDHQKYISALSYCEQEGFDIKEAHYYGDAYTDRHVLREVGFPHCITPDSKLKNYAEQHGWPIYHW